MLNLDRSVSLAGEPERRARNLPPWGDLWHYRKCSFALEELRGWRIRHRPDEEVIVLFRGCLSCLSPPCHSILKILHLRSNNTIAHQTRQLDHYIADSK